MKTLFILKGAPYGSERTCNGVRLAREVSKQEGNEAKVFMMGDAAAHRQQKVPAANVLALPEDMTRIVQADLRRSTSASVA